MSWSSDVVASMQRLKAAGYAFEESWQETLRTYPQRRQFGRRRQLRIDDREEPSLEDFMRERLREAWHGLRPELGLLGSSLPEMFGAGDGAGTRAVGRSVGMTLGE